MVDEMADEMQKVLRNLNLSVGADVQLSILEHIETLLHLEEGDELFDKHYVAILTYLIALTQGSEKTIVEKVYKILVNISAEEKWCRLLLSLESQGLGFSFENLGIGVEGTKVLRIPMFENTTCGNLSTMLMLNLTSYEECVHVVMNCIRDIEEFVQRITKCILPKFDAKQYFPSILLNFTAVLPEIRRLLADPKKPYLWILLPFAESKNENERFGAVGIVKNLCMDPENHEVLLTDFEVLPTLLSPLVGEENYTDEEISNFPIELQYVEEKQRDSNPTIRKMALEGLYQLCALKKWRLYMRSKNTYLILRDYHKWETVDECLTICEDLVNVLIRTEDEIGIDNLHEIPTHTQISNDNQTA